MKWSRTLKERKKVRILAHMVSAYEKVLQEIRTEKESKRKPGSIFVVKDIIDVVDMRRYPKNSHLGL